jgi:hypothetical protein
MSTETIDWPHAGMVIDADGIEIVQQIDSVASQPVDNQLALLRSLNCEGQARGVTALLSNARTGLLAAIAAQNLPGIMEFKAKACAVREIAKQLKLSREVQDDATEFVRRAERGLGVAIREGQARGEIETPSEGKSRGSAVRDHLVTYEMVKPKPTDFAGKDELRNTWGGIYDLTDGLTDEQFDQALSEARAERNLSRANVSRKCKAIVKPPIESVADNPTGDEAQKKVRKTAAARRVMDQLTITINTFATEISTTDPQEVDAELHKSDIADIRAGLGVIKKFLASVENNERKEQ